MSRLLEPRWHGNGFVQLYLNEVTRLYVWSPELPPTRVVNARAHDHNFEFTSRVLLGRLTNITYRLVIGPRGDHQLSRVFCGTDDKGRDPESTGERCTMELCSSSTYVAGEDYRMDGPGYFHETQTEGLTATLMTKTRVHRNHEVMVTSPWNEAPDHAFSGDGAPSRERMMAEVRRALGLLR